jgi:predicted nucleotidyltransferase
VAEPAESRRQERDRLLALARGYVEALSERAPVVAAAVVGSVARGDFNVWSDVDVVVVVGDLPGRAPDRALVLVEAAPPGVQPVGFTPDEFRRGWERGNPLAREVLDGGVMLVGEDFFRRLNRRA